MGGVIVLCSRRERTLWARASVFADGFDLDAAEEVCSGAGIEREDVHDLAAQLIDRSILTRTYHRAWARYGMVEAIRGRGQERLAHSGHKTLLRTRHRDYYERLAKQAEAQWLGPGQDRQFVRLQREHANLLAAMDFCANEAGEARTGLEMAAALWPYWLLSGSLAEGRRWLDRAIELRPEPSSAHAKALWVNGWLALRQGAVSEGILLVERSRALARWLGDETTMAHAIRTAGLAALLQGDHAGGAALLKDALDLHRGVGDPNGVWCTLYMLTMACIHHEDADRAVAFGEECLALAAARGADLSKTSALLAVGLARWLHGEREGATWPLRESLRLKQSLSDRWDIWLSGLEYLGEWEVSWSRRPSRVPVRWTRVADIRGWSGRDPRAGQWPPPFPRRAR
jgi:hypothetical protein